VLVKMGEQRALGSKWDGNSWRVGISDPAQRERAVIEIPIMRGAIATSGGYGCSFDNAGNFTHILDPRTGRSARHFASITVTAASATDADGLSTALAVDGGSSLLKRVMGDGIRVFAVPFDGTHGYWLA
jgi:thiamine biosynthesis lipoprotein